MRRMSVAATAIAVFVVALAGQGFIAPDHAGAAEQASSQLAPDIVRDIQRNLNSKGYDAGSVDGVFGASTKEAVAAFQQDNSLPGAGRVDQRTLAALGVTGSDATRQSTAVPSGQTLSPEMVANVQGELKRLGYDIARVDGVWGESTRQALTEFQRDRDLAVTGRIDRGTLAALEAGGVTQTGELPDQPSQQRR